ncbi:hypothetical protein GOODEAATRI_032169, partial [Goodea atripinnis]
SGSPHRLLSLFNRSPTRVQSLTFCSLTVSVDLIKISVCRSEVTCPSVSANQEADSRSHGALTDSRLPDLVLTDFYSENVSCSPESAAMRASIGGATGSVNLLDFLLGEFKNKKPPLGC